MRPTLAAALFLLPTFAAGQERPPIAPTRDVLVTYRASAPVQGRPQPQNATIRIAITAGGRRLRVEGMGAAGREGYMIVDRDAGRAFMVMPQQRSYMEMPPIDAFARGFILEEGMRFTRRGSETVAGLRCTVWEVAGKGHEGTACVTDDGVLLKGRGADGKGGIEATQVRYAPQPADQFQPPREFRRVDLPAGMPPASRPPGR